MKSLFSLDKLKEREVPLDYLVVRVWLLPLFEFIYDLVIINLKRGRSELVVVDKSRAESAINESMRDFSAAILQLKK